MGLVGHGEEAANYYVTRQAGCALDYYTGAGERRGQWVGSGSRALGLAGALDIAGEHTLRRLLAGVGPDGDRLIAPVLRAHPRARVPAAPLVAAVRAAATAAESSTEPFLDKATLAEFAVVARSLTRGRVATAGVRADVAVRIATAAGLDPHAVYEAAVPDKPDILAAALAHVGGRVDVRRAGIDLTFSAPKSVSLLFAFGNATVTEEVRSAHQAAIREALVYLEHVAGHGLRGHHGDGRTAQRIGTNRFIAVAFEHRTSRALDPQLHTHVVVANLLHGKDGQWSALDTRAVHRHARTAGFIYQAVLRSELTHALEVSWTPVRKGQAELLGIPSGTLRWFSTRRGQIEDQLATVGATGARAAQVACMDTRPAKERLDAALGLRELWRIRARQGGFDPTEVVAKVLQQTQRGSQNEREPVDFRALTRTLLGPDGLTQHQSTFDRTDVLRALCEAVSPTATIDYRLLGRITDHVLGDPDVVPVSSDPYGQARWTTREMLAVEGRALDIARVLRDGCGPGVAQHLVEAAVERHCLAGDQAALVRALTASTRTLHVVVGPAGSGKTASLAAANIAWQAAGHTVVGTSLSALAARNLQQGAGISSTSLARLLGQLDRATHAESTFAQRPVVLVIDEAGMVDTRTLARILEHAHARRMTLILVGDPSQLPEIGAGGLFARLARDKSGELTRNKRQIAQWEQRALSALRSGDVSTALDAYYSHARVCVTADYEQLQNSLADDYLKWRTQLPQAGSVLLLAATRRHAQQLNDVIRRGLAKSGQLTGPEITCGRGDETFGLCAGDEVLISANDYNRGLLNGERARITSVDVQRSRLMLATADDRVLTVSTAWAGEHLSHGYALTCHKAQGQTADVTLVAGSAALTREVTYTALSRGRSANSLYLAPDGAVDLADTAAQAWITGHVLANARRRMSISQRQTLATELRPRKPSSVPMPDRQVSPTL